MRNSRIGCPNPAGRDQVRPPGRGMVGRLDGEGNGRHGYTSGVPPVNTSIAACALVLFFPQALLAQGLDYVKAHYTKHEHKIPMRDGALLFTAVYTPRDTSRKYPILMIRTQSGLRPYGA